MGPDTTKTPVKHSTAGSAIESARTVNVVDVDAHSEEEDRFHMSEITAAFAHLYNMQDAEFNLDNVSRVKMAEMLGVARSTVFRCIKDASSSYDLAAEIKRRMIVITREERAESQRKKEARAQRKRDKRKREAESARRQKNRLAARGLTPDDVKPLPIKQAKRESVTTLFE